MTAAVVVDLADYRSRRTELLLLPLKAALAEAEGDQRARLLAQAARQVVVLAASGRVGLGEGLAVIDDAGAACGLPGDERHRILRAVVFGPSAGQAS